MAEQHTPQEMFNLFRQIINEDEEAKHFYADLPERYEDLGDEAKRYFAFIARAGIWQPDAETIQQINAQQGEAIPAETPDCPSWVNTENAKRAWREDLSWRCDAASADHGPGVTQVRSMLLRRANIMYGKGE